MAENPIFKTVRFGMFVHWGIYAVPAWHEQAQWRRHIPQAEYIKYKDLFNPAHFNPDQWLDLLQEAGMGYLCFTTKHHDGFCMWDTDCTDYKITRTPYGRDVLAMLAEACHRRNIKLSLYYSCPDWHHPNSLNFGGDHQLPAPNPGDHPDYVKYIDYVRAQIRELCTRYGEISQLFWDISPRLNIPDINALVRELQPGILINDRGFSPGDYSTPERGVPEGAAFTRPTEACQSVGSQSWGYRENEDYFTPPFLIRCIDKIFCMGGNYLLNVGPKADGTIPQQSADILRTIGKWYHRISESVIGTTPATYLLNNPEIMATRRGDTLYLHFPKGLNTTGVAVTPLAIAPLNATLLNTGEALQAPVEQLPMQCNHGPCLHIRNLPANRLTDEVPVIRLDFAPGVLDTIALNPGKWNVTL